MFRKLDDRISVWGQIEAGEVEAAAAQGFTTVVNNRPDGEDPGQPTSAEIRAASEAQGLAYYHIPIDHSGFPQEKVQAMAEVLNSAEGPVLAFCRSGTRSTLLWALARSSLGDTAAELQQKAAGAGYNLAPVAALLK